MQMWGLFFYVPGRKALWYFIGVALLYRILLWQQLHSVRYQPTHYHLVIIHLCQSVIHICQYIINICQYITHICQCIISICQYITHNCQCIISICQYIISIYSQKRLSKGPEPSRGRFAINYTTGN